MEDTEIEVDIDTEFVVLEAHPVETKLAFDTVNSRSVDDDIIAVLHVTVGITRTGDQYVIALDCRLTRFGRCTKITLEEVLTAAEVLHPIIAEATACMAQERAIEDEVVPGTAEHAAEFTRVH